MENHNFFTNFKCEYFPCHEGIDKNSFNCFFCYCPLYLIEDCPGNPKFLEDGIKDCSDCVFPHNADNIPLINEKIFNYIKKRNNEK